MAFLDTTLKRNVLHGFYRGQVLKHCSCGKCKIWIPGVYNEEAVDNPEVLPDAEQAAPLFGGSSNGSGIFSYPRINAVVWCFFLNGDQNFPVYFAASNGGPEAMRQYEQIGPDGGYESYGTEHDNIIDTTDKISDAELHRINVSRGQISFAEDGSITTTVVKTNPLKAPYNVNLPYSQSNHILNDLSNVIFPGKVENAMFVSDSPYNYHTNNVVSGLNNTAFGVSCTIKQPPSTVFNEITSKIGAPCIKGYKTQCRYVYSKQGLSIKKETKTVPIYIDFEYKVPDGKGGQTSEYVKYTSHWELFSSIYELDEEVDNTKVYKLTSLTNNTCVNLDNVFYKVGDTIRISKRIQTQDITKSLVYKVSATAASKQECTVLIAAEDCKIDKWDYILSSGYDLFLCSPSEFDHPVLYFDKPLDKAYPAHCPKKVWPGIVDPKVSKYKASIILIEDRRKFALQTFNKNGTIGRVLSDSYDESYVQDKLSATGDYEYHAFKQDYEDWNKTLNYYQGQPVQANISGYSAMNMGFANDDNKHNGYISCWNYNVRQHAPKDPSEWWHYNDFFEWDQQNGLCFCNNNLSIIDKPEYWQNHIDETTIWPRWKHSTPVNTKLKEHISCGYYMNVNSGTAAWNFGHLSNFAEMSFSRISADYFGNISVEATKEFDLLLTDVRHSDHPKHCGGDDETWSKYEGSGLVPGTPSNGKCDITKNTHSSLPGTEPFIHNEWTHIKFTREGEISAHSTKFIELSCCDPYKQYSFTHMFMNSEGTLSVKNSGLINLMTMMPPKDRKIPEDAIPKGCCDWPVKSVPEHDTIRGGNTDWPFAKLGLRNDGDVDIDAFHQIDLFANPNQYWGRTWQSLTKSVTPGAGKASDPPAPPRAHLRLCGGPKDTANTEDIVDPGHKTTAGQGGTIMGDCCNLVQFFSTNGNIELENANKNGPSDIIIHNTTTATNGITILNDLAASKGIVLNNLTSGPIMIHTASGNITIQTESGNMMLYVTGNVELTCSGNLNAKVGGTTSVDSAGDMTLKAPNITLDGKVHVTGDQTNDANITASGKVKDSGCTLATHTHPIIDTYTGGGSSQPGQG